MLSPTDIGDEVLSLLESEGELSSDAKLSCAVSPPKAFSTRRHAFLAARTPAPTSRAGAAGASELVEQGPESQCPEHWPAQRHVLWLCGALCPVLECSGSRLPGAAAQHIAAGQPLVLRGLELLPGALENWSFDYLAENLRGRHNVFASRDGAFTYWYGKANAGGFDFEAPTQHEELSFPEFLTRRGSEAGSSLYFQDTIWNVRDGRGNAGPLKREMLSEAMLKDWEGLSWEALEELQSAAGLSSLSTSTLFCSGRGAYSRPHYDQMANLHLQLRGAKRWLLFAPEDSPLLYAYPRGHPLDRKSRVAFEMPDLTAFPEAAALNGRGVLAELLPGDALWLPSHWWHSVQSLEAETVSVNLWWDAPGPEALEPGAALLELARDVEDVALRELGPGPRVEGLLHGLWQRAAGLDVDEARLRCFLLGQLLELRVAGRLSREGVRHLRLLLDSRRFAGLRVASEEELAARAEAQAEIDLVRKMRSQGFTSYVLHEGRAVDLDDPEDTEGMDEMVLASLAALAASTGFPASEVASSHEPCEAN